MRKSIDRVLGPLFRGVVDRLDPSVEIQQHADQIRTLLVSGSVAPKLDVHLARVIAERCADTFGLAHPDWHEGADSPDAAVAEWLSSFESELPESDPAFVTAQLAVLAAEWGKPSSDCGSLNLPDSLDWETESAAARHLSHCLCLGLAAGRLGWGKAVAGLELLMEGLPSKRWFLLKRGTLYGCGDFLRALVTQLDDPEECDRDALLRIRAYSRDVLDRLIRHMEVKRDDALSFAAESLPADANLLLERLRFTLALIEASRVFGDLRYLNTALKANDWHLRSLQSRSDRRVDNVALHYLASVSAQELRMREVFGA